MTELQRLYDDLQRWPVDESVAMAHEFSDEEITRIGVSHPRLAIVLRSLREAANRPDISLRRLLRASLDAHTDGAQWAEDPLAVEQQAPRWPSTIRALDDYSGGFYGVTVIAGETGVGKSSLSVASAIEAARSGCTVLYGNAELDASTMRYYLRRYEPNRTALGELMKRVRVVHIGPGITLRSFVLQAEMALDEDVRSERLLVVLDSVNTIAELAQGSEGVETYFAELRTWLLWAMQARRTSGGAISALVVSETNAKGETKGRKADYVADFVLNLQRGQMDGYVAAKVVKGRYSGRQDLGALFFNHRTGRFDGAPALPEARDVSY